MTKTTMTTMNDPTEEFDSPGLEIPDESLTEIAQHCPNLDDRQRKYVYYRMIGVNPNVAFKSAGYSGTSWRSVETRPKVREALATMIEVTEPETRVSQKTILNIVLEGLEMARTKSQAHNMIAGAKVLAEITGNLAATKMDINQKSMVDIQHTHNLGQDMRVLQQLPRSSLERLLELDRVLPTKGTLIEDAEYVRIEHDG